MKLRIKKRGTRLRCSTSELVDKLLSPLCGIASELGYISRSSMDARVISAGVELTGVHLINGHKKPKRGAYHIGGGGISLEEATVKSMGETIERHGQLISGTPRHLEGLNCQFASYDEMAAAGNSLVSAEKLSFFSDDQYKRDGFPFRKFTLDSPMSWCPILSLRSGKAMWVPAQMLFVGYLARSNDGEPRINSAVTTGTAVHRTMVKARINALLELTQLDSAMGHWYSDSKAPVISLDSRTAAMERVLKNCLPSEHDTPKFFWLKNPTLKGHTVACVIENKKPSVPRIGVGLGADPRLIEAMYKAFLEAVGVVNLARYVTLGERFSGEGTARGPKDDFYDLEGNVVYYATAEDDTFIKDKFDSSDPVEASDLPSDLAGSPDELAEELEQSFCEGGKELCFMDLSSSEARAVGLCIARYWSPDTISLSLPGAAPMKHQGFNSYGGICHQNPHPYP